MRGHGEYTHYSPTAIRRAIRGKGLSSVDVAKRSKGILTYQTILKLEQGKQKRVAVDKLEALARALFVPVEELRGEIT
jgi:transcriptional regulator with XRE-family HTH domain